MRLLSTIQVWLDIEDEEGSTPEDAWQRCIDPPGGEPGLHDIAEDVAEQMLALPGVIRSRATAAFAEPITGALRRTFQEQLADEEALLGISRPGGSGPRSEAALPFSPHHVLPASAASGN